MKPTDKARWVGSVDSFLAGGWATEGDQASPAQDTLMGDTGQLTAGYYDFYLWIRNGGDATEGFEVQHRNAANNGNVKLHQVILPTVTHWESLLVKNYKMVHNERLRVLCSSAIVGNAQVSIFYNKRA